MTELAFWGRCSTEDRQDPEASRAWQISRARSLVEPRGGRIAAEFFDVDKSRSIPPLRRPQAALLLGQLAVSDRGFDAVVVGEPQRAFYGNQFGLTFPLFEHYGVPLWVPEVGGPIDPANEAHELIMSMFGGISKGERNRIKIRVRSSMAALAQVEGRYLGGRPPYGYCLIDLGPHPNPSKAADGKRLHGLGPHPVTHEVVRRIFREFRAGKGLLAIAEGLTRDGIPCPSAQDPDRNRHRDGIAWSKSAIRAIITNPRYTGRQVWNKQRKDEVLIDVNDVALGHMTKQRWNVADQWVWSAEVTHESLVSPEEFEQVQEILAGRGRGPTSHKPHPTRRPYALRGVLFCGYCNRRMQGNWNHDQSYYRCRYPSEYALANDVDHPKVVYLREADLLPSLDAWLGLEFGRRLDETAGALADLGQEPKDGAAESLKLKIAECDRKLAQHRAALEAGADPALIAQWMAETQTQRVAAQAQLRQSSGRRRMTREEIHAVMIALGDLVKVIQEADPLDKAELYAQLGLRLTYRPQKQLVEAQVVPGLHVCKRFVSEGRASPVAHGPALSSPPYTAFTWPDVLLLPGRLSEQPGSVRLPSASAPNAALPPIP
ncbi:recombinase family protein [Nonomuraea sp. WAC 01424]|uniref:recombinase family protein n=1 Tax=Nonomuraea sp. WAC 01424 TaxID=2203200 RepID=UPI000F76E277|nr:recombinase family protein [Nonomuraea sp. WAC 01424]RSN03136.1 recombinase family protein [Nonomuraea sp. WAC 01424]